MGTKKDNPLWVVFWVLLFCQRLEDADYVVGDLSDCTYSCGYYCSLCSVYDDLFFCFRRHSFVVLG